MPLYSSKERVRSGVPLGGIGAGKLEIFPNGTLDYFTFLNNWSQPSCIVYDNRSPMRNQTCLGFAFALRVKSGGKIWTRVLQTAPFGNLERFDSIRFDGKFPIAVLEYQDKKLPVKVVLEAFSPLVPGDARISATPGAVFLFRIENLSKKPVEVSVLALGRNIVGNDEIGRYNTVQESRTNCALTFRVRNPLPNDPTAGELSIAIPRSAGKVSYVGEFNFQEKPWQFSQEQIEIPFFEIWKKTGRLANTSTEAEIQGGSYQLGGAISVTLSLKPCEKKDVPVIYAWHFPGHHLGHRYALWFKNSLQAADLLAARYGEILERVKAWQLPITASRLPGWFKDALINNIYVLFSGTWWTKKGDFAMYEAPVICPLMGTLDVRYYGSVPLALFYPELEKNEMLQFAKAQRPNGYIPHDLGRDRLDMPNNGTTFYYWKDLNPKFILLCARDFFWTGDRKFLKAIYPAARQAMEFEFTTDTNHDFLPDNQGADQTYDVWEFHGTNSYTSSIFLASLLAMEKLALAVSDKAMAKKCRMWFGKGSKNFVKELWNGKFFVAGVEKGKRYPTSIAGQLNGQWAAHLLGLGHIAEKDKVKKAVRSMLDLNGSDSAYGVTNSIFPDGKRDKSNAHSKNIWPGESYAFAALAIEEGFVKEGLAVAEKTWKNFTRVQKNPWNQPDVIHPEDGSYGFGDYYMRNMVVWTVLISLAKKDPEARRVLEAIKNYAKNPSYQS